MAIVEWMMFDAAISNTCDLSAIFFFFFLFFSSSSVSALDVNLCREIHV